MGLFQFKQTKADTNKGIQYIKSCFWISLQIYMSTHKMVIIATVFSCLKSSSLKSICFECFIDLNPISHCLSLSVVCYYKCPSEYLIPTVTDRRWLMWHVSACVLCSARTDSNGQAFPNISGKYCKNRRVLLYIICINYKFPKPIAYFYLYIVERCFFIVSLEDSVNWRKDKSK